MPVPINWKGVYPALLTPFTASDGLDLEIFSRNLEAQLRAGIHGIVIGGSLGEGAMLTSEEKKELVQTAVSQVLKRVPIILHVSGNSTAQLLKEAELAEAWGANGLMVLPPLRYRADQREIFHWFSSLARNCSLPVMIYNNPVDYGSMVSMEIFDELQQYPSIQAVKESTRDLTNITRMRNRFGDRYTILTGVDTLALESILLGAEGWVAGLTDAFPLETVSLFEHARLGRVEEARAIYRWFMPLLELDIHPKLVQYIKLAASLTGMGSTFVRAPRMELEAPELSRIKKIIEQALANHQQIESYLLTSKTAVA